VRWGLIQRNPADAVDAPRPGKAEVTPLTGAQRAALLRAARGGEWEALYFVALGTGMRVSELLGLRWPDIDFAGAAITVRRQVKRTRARGLHLDDTKTDRPRTIPVLPEVLDALRAHRDRQAFARERAGNLWTEHGLVFPNERGRLMERQNLHRRSWKPLLTRAGLPLDTEFHTLRHTFATTCLQRGIDVTTVQHWLGHTTPKMLLEVYAHYIPAHGAAQLSKLAGYLADDAAV
jgi:integrase